MSRLFTFLLILALLVGAGQVLAQGPGVIISDTPVEESESTDDNVLLELRSGTRGLALPTITSSTRNAIDSRRMDGNAVPDGILFYKPGANLNQKGLSLTLDGRVFDLTVGLLGRIPELQKPEITQAFTINLPAAAFHPGSDGVENTDLIAALPIPEGSHITNLTVHFRNGERPLRVSLVSESMLSEATEEVASLEAWGKSNEATIKSEKLSLDALVAPATGYTVAIEAPSAEERSRVRGVSVTYELKR